MFSNKFAFAALGAACIAAAGVGGFMASRQNATPAAAAVLTTPATATAGPSTDQAVQETEAVVGDPRPVSGSDALAAKAPAPAPPKHVEASSRTATPSTAVTPKATRPAAPQHEAPPTLDRTWPSGAASTASTASTTPPPVTPSAGADATQSQAHVEERAAPQEPPAPPEPPKKTYEELVVSADSVIGLQNETAITSERARVEDRVEARVTRDVKVGDKVAIPSGARAIGTVTQVDRGGKFKERARLGIRFHTVVLADGTRLPISTEAIYREGAAPGNESAAKIGGAAVGGAILGAILGGAKGAAIGATAGAGGGAAVVAAGDRNTATLRAGEPITVRLTAPVTVTTEK